MHLTSQLEKRLQIWVKTFKAINYFQTIWLKQHNIKIVEDKRMEKYIPGKY